MVKKKSESTIEETPVVTSEASILKQKLPEISGFDMSKYIAKPCDVNPMVFKREIVTIPVKRPGDQTYFQIHPTEEIQVWMMKWNEDGELYLVSPDVFPLMAEQPKLFTLYEGMMLNGNIFLYPVQQKDEAGKWNSWHQSAYSVIQIAKKKWVRAVAERSINGYTPIIAEANHAPPEWPNKTLMEILAIAFKDRRIDTEDHPIIKSLKGK